MKNSAIGENWDDVKKEIFTEEELHESEIRVKFLCELIDARNSGNITQRQLEEMSGIKQPMIARIEKGESDPRLSTVMKILNALGKTIEIVPLKKA